MMGPIAVLSLIFSGLLFIIGWKSMAKRLLFFGLALGCVAMLIEDQLGIVANNASDSMGLILIIGLVILTVAAYVRYRLRRASIRNLLSSKPTSQKRRVDRSS